jgi:hypothetical protein
MSPELATAIIVALGGASIIPKLIDGFKKMRDGMAREEKQRNRSALGRLVDAEEEAENEATFRRALQEYAGRLRLLLVQMGMPEESLPPWPTRKERIKQ